MNRFEKAPVRLQKDNEHAVRKSKVEEISPGPGLEKCATSAIVIVPMADSAVALSRVMAIDGAPY